MRARRLSDGKVIEIDTGIIYVNVETQEESYRCCEDEKLYPLSGLDFGVEESEEADKWYCGRRVCCRNREGYLKPYQCDKALCPRRIPYPNRDV